MAEECRRHGWKICCEPTEVSFAEDPLLCMLSFRKKRATTEDVEKAWTWLWIKRCGVECPLDTNWGVISPSWITQMKMCYDLKPKHSTLWPWVTDDVSKLHHLVLQETCIKLGTFFHLLFIWINKEYHFNATLCFKTRVIFKKNPFSKQ